MNFWSHVKTLTTYQLVSHTKHTQRASSFSFQQYSVLISWNALIQFTVKLKCVTHCSRDEQQETNYHAMAGWI